MTRPKKFTRPDDLPGRVCRALECISSEFEGPPEDFADMVYRFAHIANGRCEGRHTDWLAEFERVELEVEEHFFTSPAERTAREATGKGDG